MLRQAIASLVLTVGFTNTGFSAPPQGPLTFAAIQSWAGPDAESLDFTREKVAAFLKERKTSLAAARQPEWSEWLKLLAQSNSPNLRAWALARCVEAGDYSVYPAYQDAITEHLLGMSKPHSDRSDRVLSYPPWVPGIQMPDALRIDHKSVFWASLWKTLRETPDRNLSTGLYSLWCYGIHPDQRDLILELAAHVEASVTLRNLAKDPWNDPRFWIVLDWAISCGTYEDHQSIHNAMKEGAPRDAFDRMTQTLKNIPGYLFEPPTQLLGQIASPSSAPTPVEPGTATTGKEGIVDINFNQVKILEQPPAPRYPEEAKRRRMMTNLVVGIVVDPQGKPVSCRALPGPWLGLFGPTGIAYAMRWRFRPAELNGVPQYARFRLTMPFRLK